MEFEDKFITEHKLTPEQVTAVTGFAKTHIADLKGEWDGKANTDAEAIIDGASAKQAEVTGVTRDKGEKWGDYTTRSWEAFSKTKTGELDIKIKELDEKIKNTGGSELLTKELETAKQKLEILQKKEASYDELLGSGVKDKYDALLIENSATKITNGFNTVKPSFPDTVNQYEVSAKWEEFKKGILNENTLELVDGEWMAVNKENKHKIAKLSELVSKDANLTKLLEGRKQNGPNGKEAKLEDIEGVPFKVPVDATAAERSKLINDYLDTKGIAKTSPDRTQMFTTLNTKIRESKTV